MNVLPKSTLKIRIYSDGADLETLLKMAQNPRVHGLTTNPSLMKKAGVKDYIAFCRGVLEKGVQIPISFEVCADDVEEISRQARLIASWGKNVYAKVPIMTSEGISLLPLIQRLSQEGIQLNVTAVFSFEQILKTCEALKGGALSILSVFAGRIADSGRDPLPILRAASLLCKTMEPKIQLLWASTREIYNLFQAEEVGCDIITIPPELIEKLEGLGKPLENLSLETVQMFRRDSLAAGFEF